MTGKQPADERPLDRWLRLSLNDKYQAPIQEPLPPALAELLRRSS